MENIVQPSAHKSSTCKHLKLKNNICEECRYALPRFTSIFDTGNIYTFLNIKYVNEYFD